MTVGEKIEELVKVGVTEVKLYADASNIELPMTDCNLSVEEFECIVTGNTADFYI